MSLTKPSIGSTTSVSRSRVVFDLTSLRTMCEKRSPSACSITSISSWKVKSDARPAATSAWNCVTVAPCARNRSLRCTSDTCVAIPPSWVPVERRVATADDHDALIPVVLRVRDRIVDAATVPGLRTRMRQPPRREGADPRGDDDGARRESFVVRLQHEMPVVLVQPRDTLAEVRGLLELRGLVAQRLHQVLREHLRIARDVEDVFLGVERGQLAAQLGERVDDLRRRTPHSGVEEREEPRGPAADDGDVLHLVFHS